MPTLEEYEGIAPTIMSIGEFTVTQIENKLNAIPEAPSPMPEPIVTKAKIITIFNQVFNTHSPYKAIQEAGGLHTIARDNFLTIGQLRTILRELQAMKSIYDKAQEEE